MSAQTRGWGPGWPTDRRSDMVQIRAPLSGATFPGGVHKGIAELATVLLEATERRGYRCVPGWCWGYANRSIRGSNSPSNHSWGLALDINAPNNPMTNRLVTDMPSWMPAMWEDCGFGWGGRWSGRPDAMHYEYRGRPQDVAGHLVKARRYLSAAGGGSKPPTPQEDEVKQEDIDEIVKRTSDAVIKRIHREGLPVRTKDDIAKRVWAMFVHGKPARDRLRDLDPEQSGVRASSAARPDEMPDDSETS